MKLIYINKKISYVLNPYHVITFNLRANIVEDKFLILSNPLRTNTLLLLKSILHLV